MRIVLDVDDVVLRLLQHWIEDLYNAEYGDNLSVLNIGTWDISDKTKAGQDIFKYLDRDDLYDDIQTVPGAIEGVHRLRALGHEIVFVTSRDHPGKLKALRRFGLLDERRQAEFQYVVTMAKYYVTADIIVDDNATFMAQHPGYKILYNLGHNQDTQDGWDARVNTWDELVARIIWYEKQVTTKVPSLVDGIGADAPVAVNEFGGKQSKLVYAFHLYDPETLFAGARVLHEGAQKYGLWNWRKITLEDNLNHALMHIYAHLLGDTSDEHLAHAFIRTMFALSKHLTPGFVERMNPDTK